MTLAPLRNLLPRRLLLGPGPSEVPPRVLDAMAAPLIGHLDPFFLHVMTETQTRLRHVLGTTNHLTFPVSGTGSAGMEACFVNLVEPGDRVVVAVAGVFGARMVDVATRCGASVTAITRPWGDVFDPQEIEDALRQHRPKILAIVHAETSTGAAQPLEQLGAICRAHDALLLVDAVTSLGGMPVEVDRWQIDALYSGTQKCLSAPPGLAPVTFGPRAVEALDRRKTKVQSWYLDLGMVKRYWESERFYHHTAPITMIYALHEALALVLEESLATRFERHQKVHRGLALGLEVLGFPYVPRRSLPMLNCVRVPDGVDEAQLRRELLEENGIEIGGGLGDLKGKALRIGLMGHGAKPEYTRAVLNALEGALERQGKPIDEGAAVDAANSELGDLGPELL
jgi:alanine-glyoxylate transaminase/serine-glyoxylate transaminase/serine-pyruvate transaminase